MKKMRVSSLVLSGTMAAAMFGAAATAMAADIEEVGPLPAVSGINGKVELSAGWADIEGLDDDALFSGGAALSVPVGDTLGLQFDVAAVDLLDDTLIGGNVHFFTRDPNSYLFGVVAGAGFADDANLYFVGPEAELYLGNFSIEAWGGYLNLDFDDGSSDDEAFVQIDLALYATDNLRFSVGGSSVADFESVRGALEWQLDEDFGLPLSFIADAEFGDDDFMSLSAGIKFYFGGERKSLIRRHREDDPPIRSLDIFTGIGNAAVLSKGGKNDNCDPESGGGDDGGGDDGGCGGEEGGGGGEEDCLKGDPEDLAPPYCAS